jgi:A/G-specific adenine glycosylase
MLKTAQIISEKYNWEFPENFKELTNLPGVWPYTAQAILSFWHNQNILAFDTNIEKIFARYYYGSRFYKLSPTDKKSIQASFEKTWISWRNINAAMMDFASNIDINEKININWW